MVRFIGAVILLLGGGLLFLFGKSLKDESDEPLIGTRTVGLSLLALAGLLGLNAEEGGPSHA